MKLILGNLKFGDTDEAKTIYSVSGYWAIDPEF